MPSWNMHIAHAEALIESGGPVARMVRDRNAFLFGNLIPDIYVGYMVPGVVQPIPYRVTHLAEPEHIPKPREGEFWDRYLEPLVYGGAMPGPGAHADGLAEADSDSGPVAPNEVVSPAGFRVAVEAGSPIEAGSLAGEVARVSPVHAPAFELRSDPALTSSIQVSAFEDARSRELPVDERQSLFSLVIGAWTHLLADTLWNRRVSEFLAGLGEEPNKGLRMRKQADFDLFGKSLSIDSFPVPTPRLFEVASAFPQYPIDGGSVVSACAVAHEVVRTNRPVSDSSYQLLNGEFFERTFEEVQLRAESLVRWRLGNGRPESGGLLEKRGTSDRGTSA